MRDNQKPTGAPQTPPQDQATLLDLFALSAMQGLLAGDIAVELLNEPAKNKKMLAAVSYEIAVAMKEERARRMGGQNG